MPCQLWANPTTSHPPVTIFASRSAASLDSAPGRQQQHLRQPGRQPAERLGEVDHRSRQHPGEEVVEAADHLGDDRDDLGMGVPEDRAHLAAREVEHPPPGGVLDERAGGPLGDERRERRAVAHEVTSRSLEISLVRHRPIIAGPMRGCHVPATKVRMASLDDFQRYPLTFGPSPDPPAAAPQRPPRRQGRDLGQAGGLQLGHRLRRQQDPQARVPRARGAGQGMRHAGLDRRRPVEPHPPGHRRRRATSGSRR